MRSAPPHDRPIRSAIARSPSGLADELMSEIVQQPYSDPDGSAVFGRESGESPTPRSAFDDVDDYDGWNASPPQYRDGTTIPDRTNWRQRVVITRVVPTNPTQTSGTDQGAKRIRVTIEYQRPGAGRPNRPSAPIRTRNKPWRPDEIRNRRTGGVYIAVLGTALIVALLGMSALIGQRIQNRMLVASADIRQAQLNANTAVELALLTMKQDTNWRTTYSNGNWFVNRSTGAGTCTLNVIDPDRRQSGEQRRRPGRRDSASATAARPNSASK